MQSRILRKLPADVQKEVLLFSTTPGEKVGKLARKFGINVVVRDDMPDGQSGYIERCPHHGGESGFVVYINGNDSIERQRWSLAHEIGHFFLHTRNDEFGFGAMHRDSIGFYSETRKEEAEANSFAADLLINFNTLAKLLRGGQSDVSFLAKIFWVSERAMEIRIAQVRKELQARV